MKSGVPPGSHLGPVLFDVFANDIGSGFLSEILLHADDLKILRSIRGFDDIAFLRHDIERLSSLFYSRSYFFFSLTILDNLCTQISEGLNLFDIAIIHLNCCVLANIITFVLLVLMFRPYCSLYLTTTRSI